MIPFTQAKVLSDIPTIPLSLRFTNSLKQPLSGSLHVRVSFWKNETVAQSDVDQGRLLFENNQFADFVEQQNITADNAGNGTFFLGRFTPWVIPADMKNVFVQVEYKRQSEEESAYVLYDLDAKRDGVQRINMETSRLTNVFKDHYETLDGVLLDKAGKPLPGIFTLRTSLWNSPTFDKIGDRLGDGSIRQISNSYVAAESLQVLHPNEKGEFSVEIGKIASVGSLYTADDVYLQVELRNVDDLTQGFELIRPRSGGDRYFIQDGKIQNESGHASAAYAFGDEVLISKMPSGTGSTSFEIGVGNTDPNAMIDLVANQGSDKNAILRFNGMTKKWEVSSDGLIFNEIATWDGYLSGTANPTFTIGLGDLEKSKWSLQFGGGNDLGSLSYNSANSLFSFNKNVDFGQKQLINAVLENKDTPPQNPVKGQQYFNTRESMAYFYDGTLWQKMGGSNTSYVNITPGTSGGGTTTVVNNGTGNGTNDSDFTINQDNTAGDIILHFGTPVNQSLKWDSVSNMFDLGSSLKVNGELNTTNNVNIGGTNLTLDGQNTGTPNDVNIIANQGTSPDGTLKYNAAAGRWEVSNAGGIFSALFDVSSPQALVNKAIDGSLNTITNIPYSALSARTKSMAFSPEYPGVVVTKDGTANKGALNAERDTVNGKNYYEWTTTQSTLNDIDLQLQVELPQDFVSFQATPFTLEYKTETANSTDNKIDIALADSANMPILLTPSTFTSGTADTWVTSNLSFAGAPVFAPGDRITITVKLSAMTQFHSAVGYLVLQYNGK
ncbi:MAG: hypothetical protein ACK4NC_01945 [Candidatus Gracilibacteria bacterium]